MRMTKNIRGSVPDAPPADLEESLAAVRLLRQGHPSALLREALSAFGGAQQALLAPAKYWHALPAARGGQITLPLPTDDAQQASDAAWLRQPGRRLLHWADPLYPEALKEIENPPAALFLDGDADLLWRPQIALVGSRQCSEAGRGHAARFAARLSAHGLLVSSGLALGIDAAAHEGALSRGSTLAVTGCGLDRAYPTRHRALQARIAEQGLVISEHPPGTPPLRSHFPTRNRILAGLALGVLVVEANLRSGALITARLGIEAGREVMALPGSLHNPHARGCHHLIKQGAHLVEDPEEVIELLQPALQRRSAQLRGLLSPTGDGDGDAGAQVALTSPAVAARSRMEARLLRLLNDTPLALDALLARSGLTLERLSPMLLAMELSGLVTQQHGRYQLGLAAHPKERGE